MQNTLLRKFYKARDGLAAIEFAFIAPVMITLFFGTVELSNALSARQDVTSIASTAADLVAQQSTITNADMSNVLDAMGAILYPYPTDVATIVISSVVDTGATYPKVAWSDAQNGTARQVDSSVTTLPSGLIVSGSGQSIIMVEVTYTYASASTQLLKLPITMTSVFYAKPRKSLTVTRTAS